MPVAAAFQGISSQDYALFMRSCGLVGGGNDCFCFCIYVCPTNYVGIYVCTLYKKFILYSCSIKKKKKKELSRFWKTSTIFSWDCVQWTVQNLL